MFRAGGQAKIKTFSFVLKLSMFAPKMNTAPFCIFLKKKKKKKKIKRNYTYLQFIRA